MTDNSIIALHTLINVKNYENVIKNLKEELYYSNNNLNKLVNLYKKKISHCSRTKEHHFNCYTNLDEINCSVKYCNNSISKNNISSYNIIYNTDEVFQLHSIRRLENKIKAIICEKCNFTLLKNTMSFDNLDNISKEEWEHINNNKIYKFLDYENKIETLQKENIELKKLNLEVRELLNNIIECKLDNSKIVLEIFNKSDFYNIIDKPLIKLNEM
jgi:hypothetical protein